MVPGSGLCLNTAVGCVTSVEICDYSHRLIKSHIASLLNLAEVTDYASNLLVNLMALSTTRNACPLVARAGSYRHPVFSETLC